MKLAASTVTGLALLAFVAAPIHSAVAQDIVGKVIAGYQGWFSEPGDGSPVGSVPDNGGNYHSNYETYPDMREFPASEQFPPADHWNRLPDGNPAMLFSSDRDFTILLHVRWMRQYGIDCAAVQRFGEVATQTIYRRQKDEVTIRMMNACRAVGGVKFYIEYDASGSGAGGWGANWVQSIEDDWRSFGVGARIAASPSYARQRGKPVVELWGMGLDANNIAKDPGQWHTLVAWFKDQGCYVIAGVPTGWLGNSPYHDQLPAFSTDYAMCDAISPWVVGRFSGAAGADSYAATNLQPELLWCRRHGIDYIPCVYPGTSFHNSNGTRKNLVPREHGLLMWEQFVNLRRQGIQTCFISMFDEYNEATAIAKSAENSAFSPNGQWFLWLDADGTNVSSDFYLRLARDGARMINGLSPLSSEPPTPSWDDLLDTGFEPGEKQPSWSDSPDWAYNKSPVHVAGYPGDAGPFCSVRSNGVAQSGVSALMYSGTAQGGVRAYCYYKLFDGSKAPMTIGAGSILYYWIYPEQDNARYAGVDILFTDGTTLGDSACTDQNGHPLHPSAGHGGDIPLNAWTVITSRIGSLAGKRIKRIWIVFDRRHATGPYRGYIDDVRITK